VTRPAPDPADIPTPDNPRIDLPVRVRYPECDPMGVAHHSVFPVWFEMARTELLRHTGVSYADLERDGVFIVVVKLDIRYRRPARYDDDLTITAVVTRSGGARIEHTYEVRRADQLLATGNTTLACLDREGNIQRVPDILTL